MEKYRGLFLLFLLTTLVAAAESSLNFVGVNYGTQGNNLPAARDVIELFKRNNVGRIRLFEPLPEVLEALRGSGIEISMGIRNEDLPVMASDPTAVAAWIAANMEPYIDDVGFNYITVGNEVIPGSLGQYVLPVLQSFQSVLTEKGWAGVKATTVVPASALSSSYPPSSGQFSAEAVQDMRGVIRYTINKILDIYYIFGFQCTCMHGW